MCSLKKPPIAKIETLIGAGTRIEGTLFVTGGVHLEGCVKGNVLTERDAVAVLSVAPKGVVEGDVDVPRVIVHGEVRGNIRASERLQVGPTARISGDVSYGVIEMAAGAVIQGRLVSSAGDPAPPALPPPPKRF